MNYRHAFHAGNFADVLKHVVLARILTHLKQKETPFRVVDTHAGVGLYDLEGDEARRTGEWHDGVGLLAGAGEDPGTPDLQPASAVQEGRGRGGGTPAVPVPVAELMAPWRGVVDGLMARRPRLYPGSPWLAADLTRAQDHLVFCEKHPQDAELLRRNFARSRRITVLEGNAWALLPGLLPPPERRGLVFVDPPFEQENEFRIIADNIGRALQRWATGIYAVWYPLKGQREVEAFARRMAALPAGRTLRFEISRYAVQRIDRLNGCGMIILNPPWRLDEELRAIGAYLARLFAREGEGLLRLDWIREEERR